MIYEGFTLLRTAKVIPSRSSFRSDFVASIKDKVTVNLHRKVLEQSIHDSQSTSCDDILASLDLVYGESINRAGLDPVVENELDKEDFEEIDILRADQTTKSSAKITTNEKVKRSAMHKLMHKDVWQVGRVALEERNLIKRRSEAIQRRARNQQLRDAIMTSISDQTSELIDEIGTTDVNGVPFWQHRFKKMPNNLNLK